MPRDISIEFPKNVCLVTARTIASRLWFVNSPELEEKILAHLAKYQEKYSVEIYAFVLMGNHYHLLARFPEKNRYKFIGAFNSIVAKLVNQYQDDFVDGKLWGRRARTQVVPNNEDVEDKFWYTVLNPVSSGLVPRIGDFASYRCLQDVINGQSKIFKLVNWQEYSNKKRRNRNLKPADCTEHYRIRYSRLPGYEGLTRDDYKTALQKKLIERTEAAIAERKKKSLGFAGSEVLKRTRPGAFPRSTKTSERYTKRPLVLTLCAETRRIFLDMYFRIVNAYIDASHRFRNGDLNAEFPPGTHRPRTFVHVV
jgi:REP element-mobilizing transposase RayT